MSFDRYFWRSLFVVLIVIATVVGGALGYIGAWVYFCGGAGLVYSSASAAGLFALYVLFDIVNDIAADKRRTKRWKL